MRSAWLFPLGLALALLVWLSSPLSSSGDPPYPPPRHRSESPIDPPFAPGVVLVKFKEGERGEQAAIALKARGLLVEEILPQLRVKRIRVPAGKEMEEVMRLRTNPDVEYAEPDYLIQTQLEPNDLYYRADQWSLARIDAPGAWDITTGASNLVIAIVDTGIDLSHPDLAGKIVSGASFVNYTPSYVDDEGHGTHVAGIAAANSNNEIGIAGVVWNARLMSVKVLDNKGRGWASDGSGGIRWAADQGARIINLSWGTTGNSEVLCDAVRYAANKGALVVAAAGNSGENLPLYPAACSESLGVAATDSSDSRAYFSNYGPYVDVAAPGVDILSTYYDPATGIHTYTWLNGTSMAAPHVAGLAALIWSANPALSAIEVGDLIRSTALDLGTPGRDDYYGYGRINASAAVRAALSPSLLLQADPAHLYFLADPTTAPAPQLLYLNISSGSSLRWQATADRDWLLLDGGSIATGQTPSSIRVTADTTKVVSGTLATANVHVQIQGAPQIYVDVPVTLSYLSRPLNRLYLPVISGDAG